VPTQPPTLLYVPNLPAGEYELSTSSPASAGILRLEVGREAWPLATWAPGDPAPVLTLDAEVHSVRVLGNAPPGTAGWLRPRRVEPSPPRGQARRVTRIGDVVVYSMDDDSYPDPAGVWTSGNRSTRLLLAAGGRAAPIDLHLEAGPAPVEVSVASGSRVERVTLAAAATRDVALPAPEASGVYDVRIDVRGGFAAAALGNPSDARTLGVRLGFRMAPPVR
jgi:hypothetical protein